LATLIHNPTAGDGRPTRRDLERILADAGFQVRYQSTKGNWKKALDRAPGLIVAAGGDGTVAKVFREVAGRDIRVAVLAIGTANNLARSLGLLGDARDLVASWDVDHPVPFDVGVARSSSWERVFVESFGGGIFVEAIERGRAEVEQGGALTGTEIDRALQLMLEIVTSAKPLDWSVEVDGADHSNAYLAVEAMNVRLTGPGVALAPASEHDDGLLDVCLVPAGRRQELTDYLRARLGHHEVPPLALEVVKGRQVRLRPPARGHLRRDDELLGSAPDVTLSVRPGAVQLVRSS
jgi:diacylglycerol kinase family enzyme